ncbi:hypothetical protein [Antarcticibacterium sp. 1MA-6-2]|uniref:hypothetical protein n=1 Tax=Antarcticibacterium sp. 1MA-6-2 TaxID=2908210 RepID=UPI0028832D48|nr:hypothetical protein [Antarcticibacterium sp. 1MA-6-2]
MRKYYKAIGIGFIIGLVLFFLEQSFRIISGGEVILNLRLLESLSLYVLYSVPLSFVNGYYFGFLNTLEWKRNGKWRFGIGLLGSIFLTLFTIFLIRIIHKVGFT